MGSESDFQIVLQTVVHTVALGIRLCSRGTKEHGEGLQTSIPLDGQKDLMSSKGIPRVNHFPQL